MNTTQLMDQFWNTATDLKLQLQEQYENQFNIEIDNDDDTTNLGLYINIQETNTHNQYVTIAKIYFDGHLTVENDFNGHFQKNYRFTKIITTAQKKILKISYPKLDQAY